MASSVALGSPLWLDGMTWTSLLQRQFDGGAAVWDANTSSTAVNPLGGVFMGPGNPLEVTALASPAMSVQVNAGYVAITHPTQGHGVYLFGLRAQAALTVAPNTSGASRIDIVVARVHDSGSGSSCDVEIIAGTPGAGAAAIPASSLVLAIVTVASGASSITSGNITDKRTYTVAPGGILPASASNVPALAEGQVTWDTSTGQLLTLAPAVTESITFHTSTAWTCPDGVDEIALAEAIAGGGGGGGGFQDDGDQYGATQGGAGGGGAEYAAELNLAVTPGGEYEVIVGAAGIEGHAGTNGSSGSAAQNGGAGSPSTFAGDETTLTANAGQGGEAGGVNYPNAAGQGGHGSTNTIHYDGGYGGVGGAGGDVGSGGGGGASGAPGAAGGNGGTPRGSSYNGSSGGTAGPGGGNGGAGAGYGGYGASGSAPGGGAGGGYADSYDYWNAGGTGGGGMVRLTWVLQPAQLVSLFTTDSDVDDIEVVSTSTGTSGSSGVTAGSGSAYGWGIGYGSTTYTAGSRGSTGTGFDADGTIVPQIEVEFDADGQTDFQIDAKYQFAVPEAAVDSASPLISTGQCRVIVAIDGTVIDQVYLCCSASSGVTRPGDGGAFTVFTSAQRGTTPKSGTHVATLAVETMSTLSGQLSGAHVGNLKSVGTSVYPFGGSALPPGFTSALVAENCSLRVAGIMLATL